MLVPSNYFLSCFKKQAQFGLPGGALPGMDPIRDAMGAAYASTKDQAHDIVNQAKAHSGHWLPAMAGLAAILGAGYLSHKGVQHLSGIKPAGSFADNLEKALMAHHVEKQLGDIASLTAKNQAAQASGHMKNMAIGGLGSALVLPHALSLFNSLRHDQVEAAQPSLELRDKRKPQQEQRYE